MLSALPVSELRGGIPVALAAGVDPALAFAVCVVANLLVIPVVFLFLDHLHDHFLHLPGYRTSFDYFLERTRARVGPRLGRWGYLGLTLFVAAPLPVTGAYTGTLAAWFFGLSRVKAAVALGLGVLAAGTVVLILAQSGLALARWFV